MCGNCGEAALRGGAPATEDAIDVGRFGVKVKRAPVDGGVECSAYTATFDLLTDVKVVDVACTDTPEHIGAFFDIDIGDVLG